MDRKVQSHEFGELWVVIAEHGGKVGAPILGGVDRPDAGPVPVQVPVDGGGHGRQLGNQIHRVFVAVLGNNNNKKIR